MTNRIKKRSLGLLGMELCMVVIAVLFLSPFYFVITNSFKSMAEIIASPATLPEAINLGNYIRAWNALKFDRVLLNTMLITLFSLCFIIIFSSMSAYRMVRKPTPFNKLIFFLFVASMVVPFQSIMIPLVKVMNWIKLINSIHGLVICYFGIGIPFAAFLYHGFVKSVPVEIEESAKIDGCSDFRIFWNIVFPLLSPMTVTVLLLDAFWIWNDFILPLLMVSSPKLQTIQLAINSLLGQYLKQWDLALAALVMGMTPAVLFFIALQRRIIDGIASGAVKG